jgi:hypothetical protein
MPKHRRNNTTRAATRMAELAIAAPQVVALRTTRMLAARDAPGAHDRAEFLRMHTEKALAFWECTFAIATQLVRMSQESMRTATLQLWRAWASPWWLSRARAPFGVSRGAAAVHERAMTQLIDAAMAPLHKRATANARRLSRKRFPETR